MKQVESSEQDKQQVRKHNRRSLLLGTILGLVAVILLMGGYRIYTALHRPSDLFIPAEQRTAEVTAPVTPSFDIQDYLPIEEESATEEEIIPPELLATATPAIAQQEQIPIKDSVQMSGIVNVALFGIDAREDDSSTSGSMPHTDVNMVVAVNFDTKEVSLISLARDVFTTVPGHSGFYKFSGVRTLQPGAGGMAGGRIRTLLLWGGLSSSDRSGGRHRGHRL